MRKKAIKGLAAFKTTKRQDDDKIHVENSIRALQLRKTFVFLIIIKRSRILTWKNVYLCESVGDLSNLENNILDMLQHSSLIQALGLPHLQLDWNNYNYIFVFFPTFFCTHRWIVLPTLWPFLGLREAGFEPKRLSHLSSHPFL